MDILTAMLGLKVAKDYMIDQIVLTPEARFGVTYDITRSDDNALVTLANGAAYRVQNENLKRMAYEVGAGVTAAIDDRIDFTVSYDGSFRKDYQDHTGLFTVKYHF
jgi:outer membrane autotransporter protein